jgi:predicted N-acetyltransferase YhbS
MQTNNTYLIRRGRKADGEALRILFNTVFDPEPVGILAEVMFKHLPRLTPEHWFIAENAANQEIVSGFVMIPWEVECKGLPLKTAEMGIVGTLPTHQGQGIQRRMNAAFDAELAEEEYDLAIIQGIPGFYHQFGYHYAIPLENHLNLELHRIDEAGADGWLLRQAGLEDIPFLAQQDALYRRSYFLSTGRDEATWRYLLTHGLETEYASEYWIGENSNGDDRFYARLPFNGFGEGQIVSEVSENISFAGMQALLTLSKSRAKERGKPYIRFNLHNDSRPGRLAIAAGGQPGRPYAWQVKLPNPLRLLEKLTPVLEGRLGDSPLSGYTGVFQLDTYRSRFDLVWEQGRLTVRSGSEHCPVNLQVPGDLLASLLLGARTWRELQSFRPDVFSGDGASALLADVLFPAEISWLHEPY